MKITSILTTHRAQIYMAGDLTTAHRVVREHCYANGACFTITPTKFIYTGGEEDGFVVGIVNYPRFPSTAEDINMRGRQLIMKLLPACNQRTALLVTDTGTEWCVLEPPGASQ